MTGISLKPIAEILQDWQLRSVAITSMASKDLAETLRNHNPYELLATLSELFNHCDYTSNLSDDAHIRLSAKLGEMAIRAGRGEGAI